MTVVFLWLTLLLQFSYSLMLKRMSESMIPLWYDNIGTCLLSNQMSYLQYNDAVMNCSGGHSSGMKGLFPLQIDSSLSDLNFCCTVELPLRERGYLDAFDGFDDPSTQRALDVLDYLSDKNKSLIFIGDSMNQQFFSAFKLEIRREISFKRINDLSVPDAVDTTASLRQSVKHVVDSNLVSNSFSYRGVTVICMKHTSHRQLLVLFLINVASSLNQSLLILFNEGLHHQAKFSSLQTARVFYENLFSWLSEIKNVTQSEVIFRETTPQNFDSYDGSFENWETPYDWNAANSWDSSSPLYHCKESNMSRINSDLSSSLVRQMLDGAKNYSKQFGIKYLEVYAILQPFYKLHYGNCHAEGGYRFAKLDCTHYCGFVPLMWLRVWENLYALLT